MCTHTTCGSSLVCSVLVSWVHGTCESALLRHSPSSPCLSEVSREVSHKVSREVSRAPLHHSRTHTHALTCRSWTKISSRKCSRTAPVAARARQTTGFPPAPPPRAACSFFSSLSSLSLLSLLSLNAVSLERARSRLRARSLWLRARSLCCAEGVRERLGGRGKRTGAGDERGGTRE